MALRVSARVKPGDCEGARPAVAESARNGPTIQRLARRPAARNSRMVTFRPSGEAPHRGRRNALLYPYLPIMRNAATQAG